jgi:hypothetical protein
VQGKAGVGIKIPNGVVKVKKQVPVLHPANYEQAGIRGMQKKAYFAHLTVRL